jgi:hypothetical protein
MQIRTSFTHLSSANFVSQVELILTSLTGNASFPEPWPSTTPTLAQLQAAFMTYQTELNATNGGNESRILSREDARQVLADDLTSVAFYLQSVAKGDGTVLGSTGFPLKKVPQRVLDPQVLPPPDRFDLSRGPLSGSLVISASKVQKAASYDVQIATADPTVESNWTPAGSFATCRRIELDGLTPGKTYSVRMRTLGSAGPGPWTSASSLMVV